MRCHNFADCPPCPCRCLCPWPGVLRPCPVLPLPSCPLPLAKQQRQQHENCHISKSLLTSGLWLQQLMESFPLARLAHSFGSANQLAVPADHSIKSSFHFVLASLYFSLFSPIFLSSSATSVAAHRTALAVIFSKCFLRFIIKIWLAAIAALFEFMCRQMLPVCCQATGLPGYWAAWLLGYCSRLYEPQFIIFSSLDCSELRLEWANYKVNFTCAI